MKKTEKFNTGGKLPRALDRDISYFVYPCRVIVEGVKHHTYGIGVLREDVMIYAVPDISTNFDEVKALVRRCNEGNLSLIHLRDIVEDFISEM